MEISLSELLNQIVHPLDEALNVKKSVKVPLGHSPHMYVGANSEGQERKCEADKSVAISLSNIYESLTSNSIKQLSTILLYQHPG